MSDFSARRILSLAVILMLLSPAAFAGKQDDLAKAVNKGTQVIRYLTVATDNGIAAVGITAKMFPEEKAKPILDKIEDYNKLKKGRGKDNLIDEEQLRLATEISHDMAQMEPDWRSYEKSGADKTKLLKADKKLALVVVADGKATLMTANLIPALAGLALNPIDSLKSGITHLNNIKKAKKLLSVATVAKDHIPLQQKFFTTTAGIVKNIAGAEGIGLPGGRSDKDPDDAESLEKDLADEE